LLSLKEGLTLEGLDCVIQSVDDLQETSLLIYSGTDHAKRDRLIRIKTQAKIKSDIVANQPEEKLTSFQLDAFFPFIVEDLAMMEIAQFLHFLNLQIEIPGFYLNYVDNTILYRYVLLSQGEHIPQKIIMALVGIVMLFQDVFGQVFERLAKGEVSFANIMQEVSDILAQVKP